MILERASRVSGLSIAELTGPSRKHLPCLVRYAIMSELRHRGDKLEYIGALLNRDHSTVKKGIREAEALRGNPIFESIRSAIA
ncbi:hypothetical protein [Sphingobium bisphenolivorans]|uniref:hypothetical protein n=1 Tax=Sphingobium bisphenolivorans TaxID=1335760 RepID=UPI0003A6A351|nr:hypothetical protein [Sphingobium bisphenolivorans]